MEKSKRPEKKIETLKKVKTKQNKTLNRQQQQKRLIVLKIFRRVQIYKDRRFFIFILPLVWYGIYLQKQFNGTERQKQCI